MAEADNGPLADRVVTTKRQVAKSPGARRAGGKKAPSVKLEKRAFFLDPRVVDALVIVCRRMEPRRDPSRFVNDLLLGSLVRYDVGRQLLGEVVAEAASAARVAEAEESAPAA